MANTVEIFANQPTTTVSSGGTAATSGTETWTVASSATFPAANSGASPPTQFHVSDPAQPTELIAVTLVSGNTWTVTRGAESTTPVTHAAGFTVNEIVTAGGFGSFLASGNNLSDVASASGARSNLGLGSAAVQNTSAFLQPSNNLSDVSSAATSRTNLGIGSAGTISTPVSIANGGTGQASAAAAYNALSPMTTTGDIEYESAANTASRLAGNTAATKKFLTQTGTGTASQAPAWGTIATADIPSSVPVTWGPADQGFLAWNYDGPASTNGASAPLATAGKMFVQAVKVPVPITVTNIVTLLAAAGGTLTTGQCFAALYQGAAGALLGATADQSANWAGAANTLLTMPINGGTPVSVAAGIVYVGWWFQGTTGPSFWRTDGVTNLCNAGLPAANSRWGAAQTGLTSTAPATLATITSTNIAYWVALS